MFDIRYTKNRNKKNTKRRNFITDKFVSKSDHFSVEKNILKRKGFGRKK